MIRYIYSLLFYLAVPLILLRLLYRSLKAPAYRQRWSERFAFSALSSDFKPDEKSIWVHSVSVGETLAAVPLIRHLLKTYPQQSIVVTTMTPTGSERVRELFGNSVVHLYLPYDLPGAMNRFIRKINPSLLIIMETELWPNALHQCHKLGVRIILANARLSEKSASGYKRFSSSTQSMLKQIDCIAAQTELDATRFIDLGADVAKVNIIGSLKFDLDPPLIEKENLPEVFQQIKNSQRPVLIAASTRDGEEEKVLDAYTECLVKEASLLLVLVPRHPERFKQVARLCEDRGLNIISRSGKELYTEKTQVFLGDSMGEMWLYFYLADLAFIGGSLVNTGCHNVLEPAAMGIPILVGPSQFNFETICNQLQDAGALITVDNEHNLAKRALQLLDNAELRDAMGAAGKNIIETNKGSLERVVKLIEAQLQ